MTVISHNLIGKIDEKTVALLSEIETITRDLKLPFFIVGATARDILLQHAYGIRAIRATLDIDIGVFVSDWGQFQTLKEALMRMRRFSSTRQVHRVLFENEVPLDIIPFGGITDAHEAISWPPEHAIEMRIAGFQECYHHAISVMMSAKPKLVVKVVSLAGLAILKLVAWDDGNERRSKDAADLLIIIKCFIEAGNMDRFFEEVDILPAEESDYDRSSARFLGRDMTKIAGQATKAMLVSILEREAASSRGHQIAMDALGRVPFQKDSYERVEAFFNALLRGLLD